MLALHLDRPPMAFAGEIALGLVLALFIGALVVAIADRAHIVSGNFDHASLCRRKGTKADSTLSANQIGGETHRAPKLLRQQPGGQPVRLAFTPIAHRVG